MHYFSGKGCSEFLESMHYCIGILTVIGKDYMYKLRTVPVKMWKTEMEDN